MSQYDPFTYQPLMRSYYNGAPMPGSAPAAIDPEAKPYVNSVWQFANWLQKWFPTVYSTVSAMNPALLDPAQVVASGALTPHARGAGAQPPRGLHGLGASWAEEDAIDQGGATYSAAPATEWGSQVANWIDKAVSSLPNLVQAKQANDIARINISRAERGLPPIDSAALSPQMNFGLTPQTQTLVMLGIVGLIAVSVLKRR